MRAYHASLAKLETARRDLRIISAEIVDVALRLMEWTRKAEKTMTPLIAVAWDKARPVIDKEAWPGADQLAAAVDEYHSIRAEVIAAYDAMPEEQQKELVPPQR